MTITIVNFLVSLLGGAVGAYVGLRVAIARLEETTRAMKETLSDHNERLNRLEGVYFKTHT